MATVQPAPIDLSPSASSQWLTRECTCMLTQADKENGWDTVEWESLACYICGGKGVDGAALVALHRIRSSNILHGPESDRRKVLRREMICSAICLFPSETEGLLRTYRLILCPEGAQLLRHRDGWASDKSQSRGPDLLERLLFLMVFREGYSFGDCAALLACPNPGLIRAILDQAIRRL